MRNFTLLLILITFASYFTAKYPSTTQVSNKIHWPQVIKNYHATIKDSFQKRENANLIIMYLTGSNEKISHQTVKKFKDAHLTHLLTPGGLHLSLLFVIIFYFINKFVKKKNNFIHFTEIFLLSIFFFIDQFWSIKRLAFFRLLHIGKQKMGFPISIDLIFVIVFLTAFFVGHYQESPLGYLYSFSYLGVFITLRFEPKYKLILGIFLIEIVISSFLVYRISFIAIILNFLFILIFEGLFILSFIFYLSFWILNWNFIEPFIYAFKLLINYSLFISYFSLTSPSPFLFFASLMIFYNPHKIKSLPFILCLFLHTNTSLGPTINISPLLTKIEKNSRR